MSAPARRPSSQSPIYADYYTDLSEAFDAANASGGWRRIVVGSGVRASGPCRLDVPGVVIDATGAWVVLADAGDLLTLGPGAMSTTIVGGRWDAAGLGSGIVFEPYTDPAFRVADRSHLSRCEVLNASLDGVRIGAKRVQVNLNGVSVRDAGRVGVHIGGTDCHMVGGAVGVAPVGILVDNHSNWIARNGLYSTTTAAVHLVAGSRYTFITDNMIDNNYGPGLLADGGEAYATLDTNIRGNTFRANSKTANGTNPDVKILNARAVHLGGNITAVQWERTRSNWAVEIGARTSDITASGNHWEPLAHTLGVYSAPEKITIT